MIKKTIYFTLVIGFISSIFIFRSYSHQILEYSRILWNKTEYFPNFDSPILTSENYTFGLDISKYQGRINWDMVKKSHHPIEFVFIRSTMGDDRKDYRFKQNWKEAKRTGLIRGAYHYYDPNENSTKQAKNYIASVKLVEGDFPPVLDIESHSKFGKKNLLKGIKNWIKIVEKHYGVKPIIYSTRGFYYEYIQNNFKDYPIWVASYTSKNRIRNINWTFHQFSDKIRVKGIAKNVDGNDFNGKKEELQKLTIKNEKNR